MKNIVPFLCFVILFVGCQPKDEWTVIFDGSSKAGFRGFNQSSFPNNWAVLDGELSVLSDDKNIHSELIYDQPFEYFELSFEWKISSGGNSGVMYHVHEGSPYTYAFETGPEYQLLDDEAFPDLKAKNKTGADYDMYAAQSEGVVKPAGTWNVSRLICTKDLVEHWLNDKKVVSFEPNSEAWRQVKANTKWANYTDYGKYQKGFIAFQDHGYPVSFRNIKIRKLK